jgi:hypothetical protein
VLRNTWQVESRLAGHVHSIATAVAAVRGHNAGDAVGIRRAALSEVNLTPFPLDPVSPHSNPSFSRSCAYSRTRMALP